MYVLLLLDNSKTYISTVDRNNFSEASKIKKKKKMGTQASQGLLDGTLLPAATTTS